jgi:hypothetical protein
VHAMHAAVLTGIAFMVIASIVSVTFVRSHVSARGEQFEPVNVA